MKKKIGVALATLALAATMAVPAFADTTADAKAWFEQRFSAKKAAVEQAVQDGRMTQEQAQTLNQHFDEMYKFHEENGFICPAGTPGQGMRQGMGQGLGQGAGYGKMMRWGGTQQVAPSN